MPQRFSRSERLGRKRDFDRVFREGCVFRFPEIIVRAASNQETVSRLGLSVGRRSGGAVRRNRIKRLLREAYRIHKHRIGIACDIVIVPRPGWRELTLSAVEPSVCEALERIDDTFASGPTGNRADS